MQLSRLVLVSGAGAQQAPPPADVPAEHPGTVILSRSVEDSGYPGKAGCTGSRGAPATDAERQAITFLSYDLDVHLQPREHAMAVRARILVRNDSGSPLQPARFADFFQLAMDQRPRRRCDRLLSPSNWSTAISTTPGRCARR